MTECSEKQLEFHALGKRAVIGKFHAYPVNSQDGGSKVASHVPHPWPHPRRLATPRADWVCRVARRSPTRCQSPPSARTDTLGANRIGMEETSIEDFLTTSQSAPILGYKALLSLANWLDKRCESEAASRLDPTSCCATTAADYSAGAAGETPAEDSPGGGGASR